jgi:hypothetical protein
MNRLVMTALATLACTLLLGAEQTPHTRRSYTAEGSCVASKTGATNRMRSATSDNDDIRFSLSGRTHFIMRQVSPPEGAIDFRILGSSGRPAILSLIAADDNKYADYTYNGADADLDVSQGGLNLRPLDGDGAVNVWSMAGNTRLRVGSRNFRDALDFWHSGSNAYIRSTTGNVIVQSPFETRSANILGGDTFIDGILRTPPVTPSSSSKCETGQIVWDADYIYVCAAPNVWKRSQLSTY